MLLWVLHPQLLLKLLLLLDLLLLQLLFLLTLLALQLLPLFYLFLLFLLQLLFLFCLLLLLPNLLPLHLLLLLDLLLLQLLSLFDPLLYRRRCPAAAGRSPRAGPAPAPGRSHGWYRHHCYYQPYQNDTISLFHLSILSCFQITPLLSSTFIQAIG
jgi:hypothetical protein